MDCSIAATFGMPAFLVALGIGFGAAVAGLGIGSYFENKGIALANQTLSDDDEPKPHDAAEQP